jgi:hypothetical protein
VAAASAIVGVWLILVIVLPIVIVICICVCIFFMCRRESTHVIVNQAAQPGTGVPQGTQQPHPPAGYMLQQPHPPAGYTLQQPHPPAGYTPATAVASLVQPDGGEKSLVEKIKEINELKHQGILSEEEFSAAKAKIISEN